MTREEAIKTIKNRPSFTSMTYDERKQFSEALSMAIRSLESWEKCRQEIDNNIYDISTEDTYDDGKSVGLIQALDIIDKHLKEVELN